MNSHQKEMIDSYRRSGASFTQIAERMQLPISTVKSYCYRNTDKAIAEKTASKNICLQCGKTLPSSRFRPRRFCCDACRYHYWEQHKNRKTAISLTCAHCGRSFSDYAQRSRKYCSHACYIAARYGGEHGE